MIERKMHCVTSGSVWTASLLLLLICVPGLQGDTNSGHGESGPANSGGWSDAESATAVEQPSAHSAGAMIDKPRLWRRGGNRYCGQNLVRALRVICNGQYAEPSMKRSYSPLALRTPNYAHLLWRQVFDVKDTDKRELIESNQT